MTCVLVSVTYLRYIREMTGKDKEIRTDGRTDKEIRTIAISGQISNLTNNQYDRFVDHIEPALYNRQNKRGGGMIRPQRFKGVF